MPTVRPDDHPARRALSDEVHARPPEALSPPARLSYLVLFGHGGTGPVGELCRRFGAPPPAEEASHHSVDLGRFRLKWERHTEFVRFTFIAAGLGGDPFADTALALVPADWLAGLEGEVMVATHVAIEPGSRRPVDPERLAQRLFGGNVIVGATVAGGLGRAYTDFRIHPDGFGRLAVHDLGMAPRQLGRTVQRLLEIDTYRLMALLALPAARTLSPFLAECDRELAAVTAAMAGPQAADEPGLLDRLTGLQAAIENRHADSHYRFAAAAAYNDLVGRRIDELREGRIEGTQTFGEFTERRLAPAMATVQATARRLDVLSDRVARATQLLSTRVDIARERQNQQLLASMDRRARLQLRLQETVEGLSVAAVTYYVVGLIGYAAKGLKAAGLAVDPDTVMAVAIPAVAFAVFLGVRRVRRSLGDG